jgi:hypothetical protein
VQKKKQYLFQASPFSLIQLSYLIQFTPLVGGAESYKVEVDINNRYEAIENKKMYTTVKRKRSKISEMLDSRMKVRKRAKRMIEHEINHAQFPELILDGVISDGIPIKSVSTREGIVSKDIHISSKDQEACTAIFEDGPDTRRRITHGWEQVKEVSGEKKEFQEGDLHKSTSFVPVEYKNGIQPVSLIPANAYKKYEEAFLKQVQDSAIRMEKNGLEKQLLDVHKWDRRNGILFDMHDSKTPSANVGMLPSIFWMQENRKIDGHLPLITISKCNIEKAEMPNKPDMLIPSQDMQVTMREIISMISHDKEGMQQETNFLTRRDLDTGMLNRIVDSAEMAAFGQKMKEEQIQKERILHVLMNNASLARVSEQEIYQLQEGNSANFYVEKDGVVSRPADFTLGLNTGYQSNKVHQLDQDKDIGETMLYGEEESRATILNMLSYEDVFTGKTNIEVNANEKQVTSLNTMPVTLIVVSDGAEGHLFSESDGAIEREYEGIRTDISGSTVEGDSGGKDDTRDAFLVHAQVDGKLTIPFAITAKENEVKASKDVMDSVVSNNTEFEKLMLHANESPKFLAGTFYTDIEASIDKMGSGDARFKHAIEPYFEDNGRIKNETYGWHEDKVGSGIAVEKLSIETRRDATSVEPILLDLIVESKHKTVEQNVILADSNTTEQVYKDHTLIDSFGSQQTQGKIVTIIDSMQKGTEEVSDKGETLESIVESPIIALEATVLDSNENKNKVTFTDHTSIDSATSYQSEVHIGQQIEAIDTKQQQFTLQKEVEGSVHSLEDGTSVITFAIHPSDQEEANVHHEMVGEQEGAEEVRNKAIVDNSMLHVEVIQPDHRIHDMVQTRTDAIEIVDVVSDMAQDNRVDKDYTFDALDTELFTGDKKVMIALKDKSEQNAKGIEQEIESIGNKNVVISYRMSLPSAFHEPASASFGLPAATMLFEQNQGKAQFDFLGVSNVLDSSQITSLFDSMMTQIKQVSIQSQLFDVIINNDECGINAEILDSFERGSNENGGMLPVDGLSDVKDDAKHSYLIDSMKEDSLQGKHSTTFDLIKKGSIQVEHSTTFDSIKREDYVTSHATVLDTWLSDDVHAVEITELPAIEQLTKQVDKMWSVGIIESDLHQVIKTFVDSVLFEGDIVDTVPFDFTLDEYHLGLLWLDAEETPLEVAEMGWIDAREIEFPSSSLGYDKIKIWILGEGKKSDLEPGNPDPDPGDPEPKPGEKKPRVWLIMGKPYFWSNWDWKKSR